MAYKSLAAGYSIPDSQTDHQQAQQIGRYLIGKQALYVPGFPFDKYIPYSVIHHIWSQKSHLDTVGCCGLGVPVFVVAVQYSDTKMENILQRYTLDTEKEAEAMLDLLKQYCPQAIFASPYKK